MAKGILEFDLNDKYEEELFQLASRSRDFYLAIKDFDTVMRERAKYKDDSAAMSAREELQKCLEAYDVHLDMLS